MWSADSNLDDIAPGVWARDGSSAIYQEKRWVAHVVVSVLNLSGEGIWLSLAALPTPGFLPPRASWPAGVALNSFGYSPLWWLGSPYAAWLISFDPEVVSGMITLAGDTAHQGEDVRSDTLVSRFHKFLEQAEDRAES